MFPQSTTLIAAAVAVLFAPASLSAVVYGAPPDHAQLIDDSLGFAPRSEAFIQGNNTQLLENAQHVKTRQAAEIAELATTVIEGAINIFTSIQDGIKQDKEVSGNIFTLC